MISDTTLAKLLEAWQDGGLPEAEAAELLRQLASDPELRRCFAGQVALLGAVRAAAEQNPRWLALFDLLEQPGGNAGDSKSLSFEAATMERIAPINPRALPKRPATMKRLAPRKRRAWHDRPAILALAAVVALLLAAGFLLMPRETNNSDKLAAVPAAVAVVVGGSPEAGQAAGTYLRPGEISQKTGWLTLQTLTGVAVTLDAPFQAELIDRQRIHLKNGRARVRVPEGAEGFQLDSPAFDVVDLGTEFAAMVNPDGTGTCRVFEGKANVSLLDSIGEVKRTQRLVANESVRVNPSGQDMRLIKEANADYPEIKQPPRPTLALPPSYAAEVMRLGPMAYWRFEEIDNQAVPDEVENGPRLQAAGTAAIAKESGGNHSGELTRRKQTEFFQIPNRTAPMLAGDFSICLFAQFEWLQNFALISATRYDSKIQGNSFVLQAYASFRRSGLSGSGLHAVLRDPPGWDGGVEVFGNTLLRPLHWHHIAAARKGDLLTLYLDGAPVGHEFVGSMPLSSEQIFVGRLNGNASQPRMEARGLVGHIDELAVFPRALTDMEIRKLAVTEK